MIQIRPALAGDVAILSELHACTVAELITQAHTCLPWIANAPASGELQELFMERLADTDALVLVACEDEVVLSYVSAVVEHYGDELLDAPFLTIEYVVTAPHARGRGVASLLLTAAENWGRERGLQRVDLRVWASNPAARRLYEKHGYLAIELRMAKHLPPAN